MTALNETPRIASARPGMTAAIADATGLDDDILRELVHRFYTREIGRAHV